MKLTNNRDVYNGHSFGDWPYVYRCTQCQAYVGLHPDTDLPLGVMADRGTIKARKDAKGVFQALVQQRFAGKRNEAYAWLARALGISPSICHFAMFNEQQAGRAGEVCRLALGARA
ncbi:zinc-finger-containing protein [Achromobacter xylosoxidans]|uniref:zinc-finger-containing protein n=1 Tax=Alcaligenes xylosoxydans xylosoxydans TaxID=85698 RepID=UPI0038FD212A